MVFNEHVFSFLTTASERWNSVESRTISFLDTLLNPSASFWDAILRDHHVPNSVSSNGMSSSRACDFAAGETKINSRAGVQPNAP